MQRKRKGFNFLRLFSCFIFFLSIHLSTSFYTYIALAQENNLKQNQEPENKELDNLEEKIFHQKYNSESKEERITRLEGFLFGESNPKASIENRIKKIAIALKTPEVVEAGFKPALMKPTPTVPTEEEIKTETLQPQEAIDKEGIIGAINQIEVKMFNMAFNDYPFQVRINALEDRLLLKDEIPKNRTKPMLERVTILVSKADIPIQKDKPNLPVTKSQKKESPRSYSIDPKTGLLIDAQTGENVKDNNGQPISVMIPQPLLQQNYGYQPPQNPLQNNPYGNQFLQNQGGIPSPYDFLFNQQNNLDPGDSDPGY